MSLLQKIKEIKDGWYNDAFPTEEILKVSEPRAAICAECPINKLNTCNALEKIKAVKDFDYHGELRYKDKEYNGCGCPLSKKTKSPTTICPAGKW